MAEHKVPQDVEADDKLIGPFSFRQFIYLMIAFGGAALAFFLSQAALPLALIPAPVIIFFAVLALPLRKDQPMEVYLAALFKYYFKPHVRLWQPDGEQSMVEISNPVIDDSPKTKDLAGDEVSRRLSFLSNIADTQGWSTRGLGAPVNNTNLNDDLAVEAIDAPDIMDNPGVSDSFDNMLDKKSRQIKMDAIARMNQVPTGTNAQQYYPSLQSPAPLPTYSYNQVSPPTYQPTNNSVGQMTNQDTQQVISAPTPPEPIASLPPIINNNASDNTSDALALTNDLLNKVANHRQSSLVPEMRQKVIKPISQSTQTATVKKPQLTPVVAKKPTEQPSKETTPPITDNPFAGVKADRDINSPKPAIIDDVKSQKRDSQPSSDDDGIIEIKLH